MPSLYDWSAHKGLWAGQVFGYVQEGPDRGLRRDWSTWSSCARAWMAAEYGAGWLTPDPDPIAWEAH